MRSESPISAPPEQKKNLKFRVATFVTDKKKEIPRVVYSAEAHKAVFLAWPSLPQSTNDPTPKNLSLVIVDLTGKDIGSVTPKTLWPSISAAVRDSKDPKQWLISSDTFFAKFKMLRPDPVLPSELVLQPSPVSDQFKIGASEDAAWFLLPKALEDGSSSVALYWNPNQETEFYESHKSNPAKTYGIHYYVWEMEITLTEETPNGPVPVSDSIDGIYFVAHKLISNNIAKIILGRSGSAHQPIKAKATLKDQKIQGSFAAGDLINAVLLSIIRENDDSIEALTFERTESPLNETDRKYRSRASDDYLPTDLLEFVLDPTAPEKSTQIKFYIHDKANRDVVFRCDIKFKEAKF